MSKKQAPRRRSRKPSITSITYWRKFASHRIIYIGIAAVFGLGIVAYFSSSPWGGATGSARREYLEDAIATVNGEPIVRGDYEKMAEGARRRSGGSIVMTVTEEGYILSSLVDSALLRAEAKKRRVGVSSSDVEKAISEMRTIRQAGRTERLSDDDLLKLSGVQTMSDLREALQRDLQPRKLAETLSNADRLNYDDLAKSYDEIKVRHILVAVAGEQAPGGKGMPEGQAKRKAEQLLQQLRGGGSFADIANKHSDDPSNKPGSGPAKGGDLGWYKRGGGFAKPFEDAAFTLKPGEMSGLVKTQFGYHIIKVDDVRRKLPDDYEKTKTQLLETLRNQRMSDSLRALLDELRPKAKVVWQDPSLEWRYAYARSSPMGSMGMFQPGTQGSQDEMIKKLRTYVPAHKTDSAAALVLGQMLNRQLIMAGMPPGIAPEQTQKVDKEKLRAEVIANYEIALEHAEDQDTRLTLARLYREAKQNDKALDQYRMMHRLLAWDDSVERRYIREQIEKGLRELGDKKLADDEAAKIAEIKVKEEQQRKEAAAREAEEKAKAAANKDKGNKAQTTSPTSSATTGTITIPAPSADKPAGQ